MNNYKQKFAPLGIEIPSILLPKNAHSTDMKKWPVIACDQYTQDREYWEKAKKTSAGSPSTLNLIFPEVFLADADAEERIKNIHSAMEHYLKEGIFDEPKQGFIYMERDTPYFKKRRGLIAAIDLEQYEWKPQARPLIRCTEGTVPERLPPRMNIRRGAPLELPHVLLLIDDEKDSLLPALAQRVKNTPPVYNTPLMMDSGNISGWFVNAENDLSFIAEKLEELHNRSVSRYTEGQPFLFAVGDGNHSLAAAKGIWEEYKAAHPGEAAPPCRYALAEIENIYDPAIQFEPIHRVVFGAGFEEITSILSQLPDFSCRPVKDADELITLCKKPSAANCFGIISQGRYALIETSASGISTACLQPLLDRALEKSPEKYTEIDYIHDDDEVLRLAAGNRQSAGILLPPVQKSGLFETVARTGPLPRKSFSMGHSCEKRFYLECRSLL
uniref:Uncharacterized conserved protein UCP033563 n=1 Tax=uncultured bacterium contig00011 TaxID=1181503 RepID=A0A806KPZ7_9BACT|nr:uncharacterized conserved protein UCP033563 [uncultured bacterium contig00011]